MVVECATMELGPQRTRPLRTGRPIDRAAVPSAHSIWKNLLDIVKMVLYLPVLGPWRLPL